MTSVQKSSAPQETQLLPQMVTTEQQSLVLVKKLLAIAVSSITYLRGLFPDEAYGTKYVEGQKVMILRAERRCPGANQIVQWMQGCFDAIQKKYLRTVVLSVRTDPDNPQQVTEFYQFKITYSSKGPHLEFESNNNKKNTGSSSTVAPMADGSTKKASILLVRKLYMLMQNLGSLPDNVCISMNLTYYDEVTPQDYQPPGFKEGGSDIMVFEKEPVKLCIGEVVTPFHTLSVDVTTERGRLEQVEEVEEVGPVRGGDKWMVPLDERCSEQHHMIEDMEKADKGLSYLDNAAVQKLTCHEQMEVCEEVTMNSQMDTRVEVVVENSSSQMEVVAPRMKTRSGRVVSSSMEKKKSTNKITKKSSPIRDKLVSQFELPNSQDVPPSSAPKKRKFSEPKEQY